MLFHPRGNFDSFFYYVSQIFDSLVHPLKLVKIKNPFRILLTDPQLPQIWVVFYFEQNMFCWDTLVCVFAAKQPKLAQTEQNRPVFAFFMLKRTPA